MFDLKSEFLTEVTHAPLGIFAVISGWGRWLEIRLPREDQRLPGWIWSTAFVMIGLTLPTSHGRRNAEARSPR